MAITIDAIAYSPVRHDYEDDDTWIASTRNVRVDDDVIEIFQEYLAEIVYKRDMGQVSVGQFSEATGADALFSRLLDLELNIHGGGDDYEEFEDISLSFARRLINEMDGSTSAGVLFTISAQENGQEFISLLKLDLEEEATVSVLDRDTRELRAESLEDVLPEPDQLQKGCTHPVIDVDNFNLTGDVKFLQKDSQSNYFEEFIGCITSSGSLNQIRNTLEAINEMKQRATGQSLSPQEIRDFEETTRDEELITTESVKEFTRDVLGQQYDDDDFERSLYESGEEEIVADPNNAPKHVRYKVDDDIEIKAPMSALDGERVSIDEPDHNQDDWVFTIRGSHAEQTYRE